MRLRTEPTENDVPELARHTLYAYVDGADLLDVEELLVSALDEFVNQRKWSRKTWVVNQHHPPHARSRLEHDSSKADVSARAVGFIPLVHQLTRGFEPQ